MKTKVLIDPTSRIEFSSFYIKGLYDLFGKQNVAFSSKYFSELKRKNESHSFDHYMAFVVISPNNKINKLIIDFRDKPSIKKNAYDWCNKYAKVNFNLQLTDKIFHDKIISIPPGFSIKIWNFWETAYYFCSNFIKCKLSPIVTFKSYLADYLQQHKRPILNDFISITGKETSRYAKPYVFMIATLWPQKDCIDGTNLQRKTFIDVCKTLDCNFEGGFWAWKKHPEYSVNHPQYAEFKELVFSNRYSVDTYIRKTKQSAFVFNTPSVHKCHGWKLGEYLAMGKAIVSTPISNQLPEELVHGENIHIVSNTDELKNALELLLKDDSYVKKLEDGARVYYSKYVSPVRVIENILQN